MDYGTLLLVIACGIAVVMISYGLDRVWAAALPVRALYRILRAPGVIVHECSHILGCLLTGARIRKVVFFSDDGGSVTYSRPVIPFLGDVIISSAPLFLVPLALFGITWFFSRFLGCIIPVFLPDTGSLESFMTFCSAILSAFSENLLMRFNGWFLLYLFLALSLVLSAAPSTQDMKNAAAGTLLLILAGLLVLWSGIPWAVMVLDGLLHLIGYGFLLGLVYGLIALIVSSPLLVWHVSRRW